MTCTIGLELRKQFLAAAAEAMLVALLGLAGGAAAQAPPAGGEAGPSSRPAVRGVIEQDIAAQREANAIRFNRGEYGQPGASQEHAARQNDAAKHDQGIGLGVRFVFPARGALKVDSINQGPLAQAGLQVGDQVMAVNGQRVSTPLEFTQQIARSSRERPIQVVVARSGAYQTLSVSPQAVSGAISNVQSGQQRPGAAAGAAASGTAPIAGTAGRGSAARGTAAPGTAGQTYGNGFSSGFGYGGTGYGTLGAGGFGAESLGTGGGTAASLEGSNSVLGGANSNPEATTNSTSIGASPNITTLPSAAGYSPLTPNAGIPPVGSTGIGLGGGVAGTSSAAGLGAGVTMSGVTGSPAGVGGTGAGAGSVIGAGTFGGAGLSGAGAAAGGTGSGAGAAAGASGT